MLSRRRFLALGGAAAAGAAGIGLYAWQVEPYWIDVVRRPMALPDLPPALVGRTLLQLSDLHIGPVDSTYIMRALRTATALSPDFVALTGDFISYRSPAQYEELARVLEAVPRGRLGTVAALGNHDYGPGWQRVDVADRVARIVAEAGALVLRNEHRVVSGLQFAGMADYWSPEFGGSRPLKDLLAAPPRVEGVLESGPSSGVLATLDRNVSTVVLCHNPDAVDEPLWEGVRGWILAGHTHGGQCKPPFLPPPVLPVRNKLYTAGAFAVGPGRTLYINRGLGHLLQVRFNVRPEITLFTLERAADGLPRPN